ncbi:hypothetical protein ACHAXS_006057 [Conticribra weissflogii]
MTTAAPTNRTERHAQRSIDIIVHGATGYTGRRVFRQLATQHSSLRIAICGRNRDKLAAVAKDIGWEESQCHDSVFFVRDACGASDGDGDGGALDLVTVFSKAKVVLACAGPYRHCGLPVLKAAIEAKCDYLDLCGEPQFFDDALLSCDRKAREAGVLAIHAAAFDCVPAELGAAMAERELLKKSSGACAGIEIIHTVQNLSGANATTFHAAVDGFYAASRGELSASRKKVRENYPEFEETKPAARPGDWPKVPETPGAVLPGYNEELNLRTLKFFGADASAIRSSWRYLRSRLRDHYRRGVAVPEPRLSVLIGMEANDPFTAAKVMAYGVTFSTLARFKWGCDWLHSNPEGFSGGVFTSKGPTEEELENAAFTTYVTAYGSKYSTSDEGNNDQIARVKVSGPEPGYVATPRLIIALALTVLDAGKTVSKSINLSFESGVTLPGAVFGDCDEVYRYMRDEGVMFDVVEDFTRDDSQV